MTKMVRIDALFMTKTIENPAFVNAHTYRARLREYPLPWDWQPLTQNLIING